MLILAGLVSLSILGSIAAISSDVSSGGPTGGRAALGPAPPAGNEAAPEEVVVAPQPQEGGGLAAGASGTGTIVAAAPPPPPDPTERWLEAIAHALLALAGLLAIGLLILWRAVRELGRIAALLEARPRQ